MCRLFVVLLIGEDLIPEMIKIWYKLSCSVSLLVCVRLSSLQVHPTQFFISMKCRWRYYWAEWKWEHKKVKKRLLWHLVCICLLSPIDSSMSDQDVLQQYSASSQKRPRSEQQPDEPTLTSQPRPRNRFATLLQRRNQEAEEDGQATCSRWPHRDSTSSNDYLLITLIID